MTIELLDKSDLAEMLALLQEIDRKLSHLDADAQGNNWLTETKVKEMLGTCSKTLQKYRNTGKLGFSKRGRKIYYKRVEVNRFLEDNYIEPFAS